MEARARSRLRGIRTANSDLNVTRLAELCFAGQRLAMPVEVPVGKLSGGAIGSIAEQFVDAFRSRFGFVPEGEPRFVNLRVIVEVARQLPRPRFRQSERNSPQPRTRRVWLTDLQEFVSVPVIDRLTLSPGPIGAGPFLVEDAYAGAVVGPGHHALVDESGSLVVRLAHQ